MTDPTNPASLLAAKRWKRTTKRQRSEHGRALATSRWAGMTPEERRQATEALRAGRARKRKLSSR